MELRWCREGALPRKPSQARDRSKVHFHHVIRTIKDRAVQISVNFRGRQSTFATLRMIHPLLTT